MFRTTTELGRALLSGVLALSLAGCDGLLGSDRGRVRVMLSRDGGGSLANLVQDSATAFLDHDHGKRDDDDDDDDDDDNHRLGFRFQTATVTLSSVLARTLDGELVDLDMELPIDLDVVRIEGGRQLLLPDGFLPADTYDQLVLVITAVQGQTRDGTIVTIQPPGGGWTAVVPMCALEVEDGNTATVGIALNVRSSFIAVGNLWSFQPRLRSLLQCVDDED
jgi:hypothetical protein